MANNRKLRSLSWILIINMALFLFMPCFILQGRASERDFILMVDDSEDRAIDTLSSGTMGFVMYQAFKNAGQIRVTENNGIISFTIPETKTYVTHDNGNFAYDVEIGSMLFTGDYFPAVQHNDYTGRDYSKTTLYLQNEFSIRIVSYHSDSDRTPWKTYNGKITTLELPIAYVKDDKDEFIYTASEDSADPADGENEHHWLVPECEGEITYTKDEDVWPDFSGSGKSYGYANSYGNYGLRMYLRFDGKLDPIKTDEEIETEAEKDIGEQEVDISKEVIEGIEPEKKDDDKNKNTDRFGYSLKDKNDDSKGNGSGKNDGGKSDTSSDDNKTNPVGAVAATGAAAAVAGAAGAVATSGGNSQNAKESSDEKKKKYKMKVYKDFGNIIPPGEERYVYARIVEIDENGIEKDRPDLSRAINIFSEDNVFEIQLQEELAGNYKGATAKVSESVARALTYKSEDGDDTKVTEGQIVFKYSGRNGSFTNRMMFKVTSPTVEFGQPNLTISDKYDEPIKIYFVVLGLTAADITDVNVEISPEDSFTLNAVPGEDLGLDYAKLYYLNIVPTAGLKSMEDREPGATLTYSVNITAKQKDGLEAFGNIQIVRIREGLILTTKTIDCYFNKVLATEDGSDKRTARRMVVSQTLAETECSLKVVRTNEKEHKVQIFAPIPQNVKFTALDPEEQEMVDKLGIQIDCGENAVIDEDGGLKVKLRVTKGTLDAPRRIRCKIHIETEVGDEGDQQKFECDQEVLLLSQRNRGLGGMEDGTARDKEDAHVTEVLERVKKDIWNNYMSHLFPLHKMIEIMIDGYSPEYGYDEEQVAKVINYYNSFMRGETLGANAKPEDTETLMDYLAWTIDAMGDASERLENACPWYLRLGLGIATAGLSEVAFDTMSLVRVPMNMKKALEAADAKGEEISYAKIMWAGADEIVTGELQSACQGWAMGKGWNLTKNVAGAIGESKLGMKLKIDKIPDMMTKTEMKYINYSKSVQEFNARTTINKELFTNGFKVEGAKEGAARLEAQKNKNAGIEKEADDLIRRARQKNSADAEFGKVESKTEFGVEVEYLPDGSMKVKAPELSDPYVAASRQGLEKVKRLERAKNQLRQSKTPEAELELKDAMLDVREDFYAINQLKNYNSVYATELRMEYNSFWDGMDTKIKSKAKSGIAKRTGKAEGDIYFHSETTNDPIKKKTGNAVGSDTDLTGMEKGKAGQADLEINDRIQAEEVALATYETINGKPASNVKEAMEFAEKYQYNTVAGKGEFAKEKYTDVAGMLKEEAMGRALIDPEGNVNAVKYKVEERIGKANQKIIEAEGMKKGTPEYNDAMINAAKQYMEAIRNGYKQSDRTMMARNDVQVSKGKPDAFSHKEKLVYKISERLFKGAKKGHLDVDVRDFNMTLAELNMTPADYVNMLGDMLMKVSGGA